MEKFNVNFLTVSDAHLLSRTKRGNDGFGSSVQVIKKAKKEDQIELTTSESEFANAVNSEEHLQMVTEKSNENLQITFKEAIMTVNNGVVVYESLTIDDQFF